MSTVVERLRAAIVVTSEGKGLRMSLSADDVEAAADELTALTAKVALLTEALRPFGNVGEMIRADVSDTAPMMHTVDNEGLDAWHFRQAARALSEPDKEGML